VNDGTGEEAVMQDHLELERIFPATPEKVYRAWLDAEAHSAMTGGSAEIEAHVGGAFSAWDGYIQGVTQELEPGRLIIQSWRASDFPPDAPDSRLELHFEPDPTGTRLKLLHSSLPPGTAETYRQGWIDHYFLPMGDFFGESQDVS
jgi:uncharacterized protein YndB with AHSA1/START domain